jgi:hypothetical protein
MKDGEKRKRWARKMSREARNLRPNCASQSRIARPDARIVGFACIGRALRTRNVGGAKSSSPIEGREFAPLSRSGSHSTRRLPDEPHSNLQAAKPFYEGRRSKRRAKARLLDFPPPWLTWQLSGRQNSRMNREKPALGGIDPNAKQVLHKECGGPWQGFSPAVALRPQRRSIGPIMVMSP